MKSQIEKLVSAALDKLVNEGVMDAGKRRPPVVERTRDASHGDFATNAAMVNVKAAGMKPRDLAEKIVAALPADPMVDKVEIAGPGFINFHLSASAWHAVVPEILRQAHDYGRSNLGQGRKVQVEFVSANPTGPLHVGHGRGAAYGAVVADLLAAVGFEVHREYYVNDAGRQMNILAASVWLRYLELAGEELTFPSNGYKGDYVWDIAATLHREHGDDYRFDADRVFEGVPADEPAGGDKEKHIDALIERCKTLLGDNRYRY
ncbi:arginine--tRNA ligase domain-containing protein, partial [Thiolapillus sp.]